MFYYPIILYLYSAISIKVSIDENILNRDVINNAFNIDFIELYFQRHYATMVCKIRKIQNRFLFGISIPFPFAILRSEQVRVVAALVKGRGLHVLQLDFQRLFFSLFVSNIVLLILS